MCLGGARTRPWRISPASWRRLLWFSLPATDPHLCVAPQIDFDTRDNSAAYEVGYEHSLEDGRDVSATFSPGDKNLDVELVDNKFESGATWTAKASVPLENAGSNNILDAAKLTLKRSWTW